MLNMQFINICLFLQLFAFTIVQFDIIKNAVLEIQSGKRRSVKLFYENLQRACDERKIPVTNLVAELGLSSGNLSSWKKGNKPRSDTLIKIAERLGVSVNYLLGDDSADPKELFYARYAALSPQDRKTVDAVISALEESQSNQK